jgi:hypothetical protein
VPVRSGAPNRKWWGVKAPVSVVVKVVPPVSSVIAAPDELITMPLHVALVVNIALKQYDCPAVIVTVVELPPTQIRACNVPPLFLTRNWMQLLPIESKSSAK